MVWGKSVASTPGRVRNLRKYLEMTCSEALVFLKFSCLPLHETGRKTHFYRATRMHSADYAVARCLSVRPSVCLSVRPSHVGIVCKWLHISSSFFSPSGSPNILVFPYQTGWQYSDGGAECKGVWKNHDFRPIYCFIWQMTQDSHSYYERLIGNRTQAFEWYQFEWSWVTSNPDFKATISLNVK